MKKKSLSNIFNYCIKKLKKKKLNYGQNTHNAYNETKHLITKIIKKKINFKKKYTFKKKQIKKINQFIKLRTKKKIPISYITKTTKFCNKNFYINYGAIIPRSYISEIINKKLKILTKKKKIKNILDLCTGSACIAICISYLYPKSKIDASDISNKAIKIAKINIKMHKKNKIIKIIKSNLFEKIKKKKYDIIIANPPYGNIKEIKNFPKEYLHEPKISLFSKNKGIHIIQKIIKKSYKYLNKNGLLICEVGHQYKKIKKIYKNIKLKWITTKDGNKTIFYIEKENLF